MSDYFKDWIFNQLPKPIQRTDSFVDGNGDGLLKRYLRVFGMELDEDFIPYIDNFMDIIDYVKCDDKFLPLISSILGYPPSIDGLSSTYRKILANIIAIYKVKGTLVSFEMLFNLLGLEVYILEETPKKAVTYDMDDALYDNDPIDEYDSSCDNCSGYWVVYNSKYDTCDPFVHNVVDAPLLATVQNIICFLNPINAQFLGMIPRLKVCDDLVMNYNDTINLCGIPLNVNITYNTNTNIASITWQGTGNFEMQYREYPNGVFSNPIAANSGDAVGGLVNGTLYEFEIRKDCGNGSYSQWVSYLLYTGSAILNTGDNNTINLDRIDYISNSPKVVLLGDYYLLMDMSNPLKVLSVLINGIWTIGPNTIFTTINQVKDWLNTLGYGVFTISGNQIVSLGNENTLSQLILEINGQDVDLLFTQNNKRLHDSSIVDLISDYSLYVEYPLNVISILVNGIVTAGPGNIANEADFISWINSLAFGNFTGDGTGQLKTEDSINEFDKIVYDNGDGVQRDLIFIQTNLKLSDTTNNILQTNYRVSMDFTNSLKIISIRINGVDIAGNGNFYATNDELIIWLNSLNKGLFELSNNIIISKGNPNLIESLTYQTSVDATNYTVDFSQGDQRITNLSGVTGTVVLNTNVGVNGYATLNMTSGVYDKITIVFANTNTTPIHGGILNTNNNTGPYNGFLDNGNLVFINVNLGTLFQLNIF